MRVMSGWRPPLWSAAIYRRFLFPAERAGDVRFMVMVNMPMEA
jgi:hypothetical protein